MCIRDRGNTMTAYFLGKVCLAKHLEPAIPEECLVNNLSYHYDEEVISARRGSQIKTTQAMTELLENMKMRSTTGKAEGEMIGRKSKIIHTRTTVISRTAMGKKGTATIPIIITPTIIIIIIMVPVSYTHLDVYKRQIENHVL